jgi:ribosomal protein S20
MKRKILAPLALTGALAAGGLAVAVVNPLQSVSAQNPPAAEGTAPAPGAHQGPLQRALDKLVEQGTLTQAQADAVRDAVKAEAPKGGRHAGPRMRAVRGAAKVAADTIGIEPEELRTEVQSGKTIAQVAEEHGKSAQDVIDAVVTAGNQRIDKAVAKGRLTADQATKAKARLAQAAEKLVDETPHRKAD